LKHLSEFPHAVSVTDLFIPLADGTRLFARIWRPDGGEPVPAILEYLPYRLADGTAARDALTHPYLAGHGYACVRVDMRGSGNSDGLLRDEYLKQEQDDALEVIEWITAQPWCAGPVGMMGISWGGFNALQVAARRPPALRAIISLCSTDDRYADDVHYMGGALLTDNLRWASTMLGYQTRPPDPAVVGERWRAMWRARLEAEPLLIETWLRHPTRDAYWRHGSVCEDPAGITAACYLIGGWADAYSNAVPRMLERLRCPRRGLIGPWAHKYPHFARPEPAYGFLQDALAWWDHWLRGVPNGVMDGPMLRWWQEDFVPPATEYAARPGRWIAEPCWPSPNVTPTPWHLTPDGLRTEPGQGQGPGQGAGRVVVASPQDTGEDGGVWCAYGSGGEQPGDQRRDDGRCVTLDTAPLPEALCIAGAPVFEAVLTADRPDGLLIARLCDVAPDGASLRVSYGVLNLTHRDGHAEPTALPVGEPVRVRLQLNDCAHRFPAGHRVRLALSTAYWPLLWPSPGPTRLSLDLAASRLTLPHRPPVAADDALPPLPEPEAAPALRRRVLREPETWLRVTRDLRAETTMSETRDDTGLYVIEDNGLRYELSSIDRFTIAAADPLSAHGDVSFDMGLGRDDWRTRAVTRTVLRATETAFVVEASLDAWEGDTPIASRRWNLTVPRNHV
jgi:putative CocE/NonD family hydrolase